MYQAKQTGLAAAEAQASKLVQELEQRQAEGTALVSAAEDRCRELEAAVSQVAFSPMQSSFVLSKIGSSLKRAADRVLVLQARDALAGEQQALATAQQEASQLQVTSSTPLPRLGLQSQPLWQYVVQSVPICQETCSIPGSSDVVHFPLYTCCMLRCAVRWPTTASHLALLPTTAVAPPRLSYSWMQ